MIVLQDSLVIDYQKKEPWLLREIYVIFRVYVLFHRMLKTDTQILAIS